MPVFFLAGLRIVEIGETHATGFAGKLLTDLGAEVWLVEPPGRGNLLRRRRPLLPSGGSGFFEYLARGKQSLTLNLAHDDGRELLRRMLGHCDGVIAGRAEWAAAFGEESVPTGRGRPLSLVTLSARGDPWADAPASAFVDFHEGGGGYMTPGRVDDPATEYPLDFAHGGQASYMGGLGAVIALLQGLRLTRRDAEPVWNDVSEQAALANLMVLNVPWYEYAGQVPSRLRAAVRPTRSISGVVRVRDGAVAITMIEEHQWDALVRMLGAPDWATLPVFATQLDRGAHWDAVRAVLEDEWRDQDAADVMVRCQAVGVPCFKVRSMDEVIRAPHEHARGFFSPSEPDGVLLPTNPWRVDGAAVGSSGRAPTLGEHTAAALRLLGLGDEDAAIFHEVGVL